MNKKILFLSCVLIQGCFAADGGGAAGAGGLDPRARVSALIERGLGQPLRVPRLSFDDHSDAAAKGLAAGVSPDLRYRSCSAGALRPGRNGRSEISRVGAAGRSKSLSRSRRTRSTSVQRAVRRVLQGAGRSPEHIALVLSKRLPSPVRRTHSQVAAAAGRNRRVIPPALIAASHRRGDTACPISIAAGDYPGDGDGAGDAGDFGRARSRSRSRGRVAGGSSASCGGPAAAAGARSAASRPVGLGGLPAGILRNIAGFADPEAVGRLSLASSHLAYVFDDYQGFDYRGLEWSRAELVRTIKLPAGPTYNFTALADGKLAILQNPPWNPLQERVNELFIFDWVRHQEILPENKSFVKKSKWFEKNDIVFSADGKVAAILRLNVYNEYCAVIFDVEQNKQIGSVRLGGDGLPNKVALSPDGKYVAIGYYRDPYSESCFAIYNIETRQIVKRLENQLIKHFAFSPNPFKLIAKVFGNNQISVCDIETDREVLTLQSDRQIEGIKFSGCGQFIIINNFRFLKIVRIDNGEVVFDMHDWGPYTSSPCCNYFVRQRDIVGATKVEIIERRTNRLLREFEIVGTDVITQPSIQFSPCGNFLIIQARNTVRIFKKHGHPLPPDFVPDAPRRGAGGGAAGPAAAAGPH